MTRVFLALAVLGLALLGTSASGSPHQLRVAYVTDIVTAPSLHDLRGVALLGFQRAVKKFHVQGRVVQYDLSQGAAPTLTSLGRQKYDLVFEGEVQAQSDVDAVITVARRFPGTRFILADPTTPPRRPPKNVQGSIWRVEQPSYLAGYLAALMERRRPGSDVVGSVGGYKIPAVDAFIKGFEAGARKAVPRVRTLRGYSYNFFNVEKCKAVARRQIAKGAGVLFNVGGACGLGTLDAAREAGIWAIGVDVDQSFLGPHILTSVLKRFDVEVYENIEALAKGRLKTGGNTVWSLRNGAVGLGRISPKVPRAYLRKLDRVRARIVAGQIEVP